MMSSNPGYEDFLVLYRILFFSASKFTHISLAFDWQVVRIAFSVGIPYMSKSIPGVPKVHTLKIIYLCSEKLQITKLWVIC